jgi:hypothetical protein
MRRRYQLMLTNAVWMSFWPSLAEAQDRTVVRDGGVSAIWVLANLAYAGMRAQNSSSAGWRIIAFIFGFPGTLLTYFVVMEGGERAYGIELPKRR